MSVFKKIILSPLSVIYGVIIFIRNKFYDWSIFRSQKFSTPVISIGNLSVGGTGKTPHTEYLITLLNQTYRCATLSRGYKRKTHGFIMADESHASVEIGDEPLQYYKKFKSIKVTVDEKRVNGIHNIEKFEPETEVILLDDAFQHRSVKPGKSILITEYNNLYCDDVLLPAGRLREWKCGADRADIIIVSKCPKDISEAVQKNIVSRLNPKNNQTVKFSFIKYDSLTTFINNKQIAPNKETSVLVFTGIANPNPFVSEIEQLYGSITHVAFADHHQYSLSDISNIKSQFSKIEGDNKIIITTEKDIMRLYLPELKNEFKDTPVFYIPITIDFHGKGKEEFDKEILEYVRTNSRNKKLS